VRCRSNGGAGLRCTYLVGGRSVIIVAAESTLPRASTTVTIRLLYGTRVQAVSAPRTELYCIFHIRSRSFASCYVYTYTHQAVQLYGSTIVRVPHCVDSKTTAVCSIVSQGARSTSDSERSSEKSDPDQKQEGRPANEHNFTDASCRRPCARW
jgi:hypothetical protein